MALSFAKLPWLWLGGKERDQVSNGSIVNSLNSLADWGLGSRVEPENLKFYSVKGVDKRMPSSAGRVKRKWRSRQERGKKVDLEYDVVLVPSDGVCLSGSESDDSDWSIGWLEPHAPDFQSDDNGDNVDDSFAVLVPCYKHEFREVDGGNEEETVTHPFLNSMKDIPICCSVDGTTNMEQWLSSLQNF